MQLSTKLVIIPDHGKTTKYKLQTVTIKTQFLQNYNQRTVKSQCINDNKKLHKQIQIQTPTPKTTNSCITNDTHQNHKLLPTNCQDLHTTTLTSPKEITN